MSGHSIELSEVKSLTIQLFDMLQARGVSHINVPSDQYWTVSLDAFQVDKPEPMLGSILDDISDLKGEIAPVDDQYEPIIWHAFHHLSGLMQLISHADINGDLVISERSES